jgi:hypothetical protein
VAFLVSPESSFITTKPLPWAWTKSRICELTQLSQAGRLHVGKYARV